MVDWIHPHQAGMLGMETSNVNGCKFRVSLVKYGFGLTCITCQWLNFKVKFLLGYSLIGFVISLGGSLCRAKDANYKENKYDTDAT